MNETAQLWDCLATLLYVKKIISKLQIPLLAFNVMKLELGLTCCYLRLLLYISSRMNHISLNDDVHLTTVCSNRGGFNSLQARTHDVEGWQGAAAYHLRGSECYEVVGQFIPARENLTESTLPLF